MFCRRLVHLMGTWGTATFTDMAVSEGGLALEPHD